MAVAPFEISARAVRQAAELLADKQDGLRFGVLWSLLEESDPELKGEWDEATPGSTTSLKKNLSHTATNLVKAGWLRRNRRAWRLTGLGQQALKEYPEPGEFLGQASQGYRAWADNRRAFEAVQNLLGELPDGRWAALQDLAAEFEVDAMALAAVLQGSRADGWFLALDASAEVREGWLGLTAAECDEWRRKLDGEGVLEAAHSGGGVVRVLEERRLSRAEITDLMTREPADELVPPRRVWVIRGADERGTSLIRSRWRDAGVASLPADRLPVLVEGSGRERVRAVVDEAYGSRPASRREQLTGELHTFLTRMREGDIVLCNDKSDVYLGLVRGAARFTVPDGAGRAVLQRAVEWRNLDEPLHALSHLPSGLIGRLNDSNARLIDVSEFSGDLEQLLGEPVDQAPLGSVSQAELPDATSELAERLTMKDASWLQECVELLRIKPQLILHGPPGTGKTYTARALAHHLTSGGPDNVRLVQFHPAYSYEDFFEGFRPHRARSRAESADVQPGRGAGIAFDLVAGPLRRLASTALERPAETFVLIIDEINRGNLAKIFGELYFCLEYRDEFVHTLYADEDDGLFRLPANLLILGTMNTVDRSVTLMDAAMRRRFHFMELHPDREPVYSMLERWLAEYGHSAEAARLLKMLNERIADGPGADHEFRIGPSYFMEPAVHTPQGLERVWRTQIVPLLADYHHGDGTDIAERYGIDGLRGADGLASADGSTDGP